MSTQGWNRYSYVENSPATLTDPSGFQIRQCNKVRIRVRHEGLTYRGEPRFPNDPNDQGEIYFAPYGTYTTVEEIWNCADVPESDLLPRSDLDTPTQQSDVVGQQIDWAEVLLPGAALHNQGYAAAEQGRYLESFGLHLLGYVEQIGTVATFGVGGIVSGGSRIAAKSAGIVARNGTHVTGLTREGINRAIGDGAMRAGVKPQAVLDALKNPTKIVEGIDKLGRPFQIFTGENARVIVNPQTGQIVTMNPLSAAGAL